MQVPIVMQRKMLILLDLIIQMKLIIGLNNIRIHLKSFQMLNFGK